MTESQNQLLRQLSGRAETLWERIDRAATLDLPSPPPQQLAKVVGPWAKACARGDLSVLLRRLAWSEIDPRGAAVGLTALPPPEQPAPWTEELVRYCERAGAVEAGAATALGIADLELPFGELWTPWIELASEALESRLEARGGGLAPAGSRAARRLLARELSQLSEMAALARLDVLRGDEEAAPGVYARFVAACLADPIGELYGHYPVLGRQTVRLVRQWGESMEELAGRFLADRDALADWCGAAGRPAAITDIEGALSDRHHDGRQVLRVELDNGVTLAYKPRSVEPEVAVERLFAWCREAGLEDTPPAPRTLVREGYGWLEWLSPEPAASEQAARDYFRRAGALVALGYVLRGQDLHAENLVATTGGPAIVDAEVLFQPRRVSFSSGEASDEHGRSGVSVLASGLLTALLPDGREVRALGGLRSPEQRRTEIRAWHDVGGDEIRCEAGVRLDPPLANALRCAGRLVQPEEHADALVAGFETGYRFLVEQRAELLGDEGPLAAMTGVPVRVLFRGSQEYGRVAALMAMPRNQRTGLSGSLLQEALLQVLLDRDTPPRVWPLVREEREALERGDIPWFALAAGESALDLGPSGTIRGFFDGSGLDAVRDVLEHLDESDLDRQTELVRRALAPPRVEIPPPSIAPRVDTEDAAAAPALDQATRIAAALEIASSVMARVDRLEHHRVDLATGSCGVALMLAAAGTAGGDSRLSECALELFESLPAPAARAGDGLVIGGFSGVGSVVWALVWGAELLSSPELVARAESWAATVDAEAIRADRGYDLERGCAGTALALMVLAERSGDSRWLELAVSCGEHLLAGQQVRGSTGAAWRNEAALLQPGWMHGAAGIARALGALGKRTDDQRFLVAAAGALGFERSAFDPVHGNWPMFATDGGDGPPERVWRVSVCRGAPGVALGRLLMPAELFDEATAKELLQALETTAGAPPGRLQTLCCGSSGRSSVLLSAAERGAGERWREMALQIVDEAILRAASEGSFVTTLDCYANREARVGLLHGVSGIVYQLLRAGGGVHLPDVIALELLSEREKRVGSSRTVEEQS